MSFGLHVLNAFRVCEGAALVLGRSLHDGAASLTPGRPQDAELAVASILGEREASGHCATTIVLRVGRRDDTRWAEPALKWLTCRGRRVVLRTAVVMPRSLVDAARWQRATVLLELADARPTVNRALVGPQAESAAALLLHAQHLRSLRIAVAASIGPLMPTVHDRSSIVGPLMQHVVAAGVLDAHLSVGRLTGARLRALEHALPRGEAAGIARAFALRGSEFDTDERVAARLPRTAAAALFHQARRTALDAGLRVDACGCPAQCHLDPLGGEREYVPLLTPELFPQTG
jgi:hypothetical protein